MPKFLLFGLVAVASALAGAMGVAAAKKTEPNPPSPARAIVLSADLMNKQASATDNALAMDRMMSGMAATPTGNVDQDFVAMMVPHHRGAVDMSLALLRYGQNEQLRRIAQEIIVTQQQEIEAMQRAVDETSAADSSAPVASSKEHGGAHR